MAKITKIETKRGEQIKLTLGGTCIYPIITKGQYWDNKVNKFITIDLTDCNKQNGMYYKEENKIMFGLSLLIDNNSEDIRALNKAIEYSIDLFNKNKLNKKKINRDKCILPWWNGDDSDKEMYKNKNILKAKTSFQPKCFDKFKLLDLSKIEDDNYHGYISNISVVMVPYVTAGNTGVTCRLNQVQFIELNPNIQFESSCDFELEESAEISDFATESSKVENKEVDKVSKESSIDELPFI